MDVDVSVFRTSEAAARAAAERLAEAARVGAAIALSGGSTPRRSYELAAATEPDWSRAALYLADERLVPFDDSRSNARLVQETVLSRLVRPPQTHFVRTEVAPGEAASEYNDALRGVELDLVLLGIGPDGHTASLFPNAPSLAETERRAVAAEAGFEPFVPRVTMTLPMLSAAREAVFLVTGADKTDAVRRAFADEPSPATPASLVRSRTGATVALLDEAAAAALQ